MKAETRKKLEKISDDIRAEAGNSANTPLGDVIRKFGRILRCVERLDMILLEETDTETDKMLDLNTVKN